MSTETSRLRAWAEIDIAALRHNIQNLILATVTADARVMPVVKADAYGHGINNVVPALLGEGIRDLGVATPAEATRLRRLAPDSSIYLLTTTMPCDLPEIVDCRAIPLISDFRIGSALAQLAAEAGLTAEAHLDVDTGIGRAGVMPDDALTLLAELDSIPNLRITGIATHFASADEDPEDAIAQHALFLALLERLGPRTARMTVHSSNSPAVMVFGSSGMHSLVRPGLLVYGIEPQPGMFFGQFASRGYLGPTGDFAQRGCVSPTGDFAQQGCVSPTGGFRPVLSLKARVLQVRDLPGGVTISYGRTFTVPPGGGRYATVGMGYGDGLPRRLSQGGNVILHGHARPICGRICMDQMVVDVGERGAKPGDIATIIGTDGDSTQTAGDLAALIGATPHELTTCLLPRLPRVCI